MSIVKRNRQDNWSEEEKSVLANLIKARISILECKKNDLRMIEQKKKMWEEVNQFFSAQFGNKRSLPKLKEQWKRIKIDAKKNISEFRRYQNGTGGGPAPSASGGSIKEPTELSWLIKDLLPQEFEKDSNPYDDDGPEVTQLTENNVGLLELPCNLDEPSNIEIIQSVVITDEESHTPDFGDHQYCLEETTDPDITLKGTITTSTPNKNQLLGKQRTRKTEKGKSMSKYETAMLELNKKRIEQQIQFDAERHKEEMALLEVQRKYWSEKLKHIQSSD